MRLPRLSSNDVVDCGITQAVLTGEIGLSFSGRDPLTNCSHVVRAKPCVSGAGHTRRRLTDVGPRLAANRVAQCTDGHPVNPGQVRHGFASTETMARHDDVFGSQFGLRHILTFRGACLGVSVSGVASVGRNEQVLKPNARRIIATMTHELLMTQRAISGYPRRTRRTVCDSCEPCDSVAVFIAATLPLIARTKFNNHVFIINEVAR